MVFNRPLRKEMRMDERLTTIPGIGSKLAEKLEELGIKKVSQLKNKNPEYLYEKLMKIRGCHIDRCVLYTFRCAVYYAETENPDPEKLKWWNWK